MKNMYLGLRAAYGTIWLATLAFCVWGAVYCFREMTFAERHDLNSYYWREQTNWFNGWLTVFAFVIIGLLIIGLIMFVLFYQNPLPADSRWHGLRYEIHVRMTYILPKLRYRRAKWHWLLMESGPDSPEYDHDTALVDWGKKRRVRQSLTVVDKTMLDSSTLDHVGGPVA